MIPPSPLTDSVKKTFQNVKYFPKWKVAGESICQAFGNWIDGMADWQWYATLTFRDPQDPRFPNWSQVGWKSAHNALNKLNNALVMELDYINPIWIAVMELQSRGVPHWHTLVANVPGQRRMSWVDWWYEHYGIARILPYQEELGARYYLGKYLTKEVADIRFSPGLSAQLRRQSFDNSNSIDLG